MRPLGHFVCNANPVIAHKLFARRNGKSESRTHIYRFAECSCFNWFRRLTCICCMFNLNMCMGSLKNCGSTLNINTRSPCPKPASHTHTPTDTLLNKQSLQMGSGECGGGRWLPADRPRLDRFFLIPTHAVNMCIFCFIAFIHLHYVIFRKRQYLRVCAATQIRGGRTPTKYDDDEYILAYREKYNAQQLLHTCSTKYAARCTYYSNQFNSLVILLHVVFVLQITSASEKLNGLVLLSKIRLPRFD